MGVDHVSLDSWVRHTDTGIGEVIIILFDMFRIAIPYLIHLRTGLFPYGPVTNYWVSP